MKKYSPIREFVKQLYSALSIVCLAGCLICSCLLPKYAVNTDTGEKLDNAECLFFAIFLFFLALVFVFLPFNIILFVIKRDRVSRKHWKSMTEMSKEIETLMHIAKTASDEETIKETTEKIKGKIAIVNAIELQGFNKKFTSIEHAKKFLNDKGHLKHYTLPEKHAKKETLHFFTNLFNPRSSAPNTVPKKYSVSVNGYKSISAIKYKGSKSLYSLQLLCIPESKGRTFTEEQILHTADTILSNDIRITDDCAKIISSTDNPSVFFERYKLLLEKYSEMVQYESFLEIFGYQPSESLCYYRNDKAKFEKKLIDRCYNKALIKADSLKTEKAQRNQFIKAHDVLLPFQPNMEAESCLYIDKKFKNKIQNI